MRKTVCRLHFILIFLCTNLFSQGKNERYKTIEDTVNVDKVEYELLIQDPGLYAWLFSQPSKQFYSKEYYEYKNLLYVSEWNYRYTTIKNHGEYDSFIDYNPETDYGLNLNYKLYYYFKYVEEKHGTKLYPSFR